MDSCLVSAFGTAYSDRLLTLATDEEVQAVLTSFGVILSTTFLRIFTVASSPLILSLPASTVIMTAESALPLADILAAESEYDMPATDEEAQAALTSFGVIFIYTRARPTPRLVRTSEPAWRCSIRISTTPPRSLRCFLSLSIKPWPRR